MVNKTGRTYEGRFTRTKELEETGRPAFDELRNRLTERQSSPSQKKIDSWQIGLENAGFNIDMLDQIARDKALVPEDIEMLRELYNPQLLGSIAKAAAFINKYRGVDVKRITSELRVSYPKNFETKSKERAKIEIDPARTQEVLNYYLSQSDDYAFKISKEAKDKTRTHKYLSELETDERYGPVTVGEIRTIIDAQDSILTSSQRPAEPKVAVLCLLLDSYTIPEIKNTLDINPAVSNNQIVTYVDGVKAAILKLKVRRKMSK